MSSQRHPPVGAQHEAPLGRHYLAAWLLLTPTLRLMAGALLAGTLAGATFEVLGLSLLGALLGAITPGDTAAPGGVLGWALARAGRILPSDLITQLIVLCAVLFGTKNLFMAGLAWVEATFAFRLQAYLAGLALQATLRQDYEVVASKRPAEHINLLTGELGTLVFSVILPTFTFASEVLLLGAVVAYLVWLQPIMTAAILLVIGGVAAILIRSSRGAVAALGQERQHVEEERTSQLRAIFGHLSEVYVYRADRLATSEIGATMSRLARIYRAFQMLSTGPRFALEFAFVSVLLGSIYIGHDQSGKQGLLVSVGIFAAAGFRLLVGLNRLIMAAQSIRFGEAAFSRVLQAISTRTSEDYALPQSTPVGSANVLSLQNLEYRYGPTQEPVLKGVNLTVRCGEMIGIAGNSGAGKTTLLETMAGLRRPSAGTILLNGTPLIEPRAQLFRSVGYVGQTTAVFGDTIRRNVAYGYEDDQIDDQTVWRALEDACLREFVEGLPGGLDFTLGDGIAAISGGQAQRLALARALFADCSFLLLDEPTSALDPATEAEVVSTLATLRKRCGVVLISHRPAPLAACTHVVQMRKGQLVPATTFLKAAPPHGVNP